MNEKRRPGKAANPKSLAGDTSMIQPIGDSRAAVGRRYWARQLIERQTPDRPQYGSTAWLMLPNEHPDKIAAAVIAAECWAYGADNLEDELKREVEAFQLGFKHGEDKAYQDSFQRSRGYTPPSQMKSFLERRAAQLANATEKPDDYKGGPFQYEWNEDGA